MFHAVLKVLESARVHYLGGLFFGPLRTVSNPPPSSSWNDPSIDTLCVGQSPGPGWVRWFSRVKAPQLPNHSLEQDPGGTEADRAAGVLKEG